jgi:hypothetical protein
MGDRRSRLGAANLTIPIVVIVFIIIVIALNRLGGGEESATEVEGDSTAAAAAAPAGPAAPVAVTAEQLQTAPQQFENRLVSVTLPVASPVGTQAFFLDVPRSPFLVKISEALAASGQAMPTGTVTVEGQLLAMTDSTRQDWVAKGLVPQQDQVLVEFATHFIEARSIQPAAAPAP